MVASGRGKAINKKRGGGRGEREGSGHEPRIGGAGIGQAEGGGVEPGGTCAEDGARVQEGDLLYELEVPKITTSKTAPATGVLHRKVEEGERVRYGQVLAVIEN